MISSAVLMSLVLPLQISSHSGGMRQFNPLFLAGSFIDCAQILGLPKFKLRDSSGNPYVPEKTLFQEPLAVVYVSANILTSETALPKRKKYIMSYVHR